MVSEEDTIDAGLKAVSDSTRRGILGLLKGRQLSVLEIAEEFPMSRPAISKHLRILKEAGLVLETPSGRQRLYSLECAPLERMAGWFARFNGTGPRQVGKGTGRGRRPVSSAGRSGQAGSSRTDWRVW